MKIDDPQVQKYISGQMSAEEERSFRSVLADHPEVADLADTLKRTAKLIHDDKRSGEKPYGMDLSAATSTYRPGEAKFQAEGDEIPESGLAFYSYKLMGNSWRVGVTILSVTLATLFLLLVVVPFLRSAIQVQSGGDRETEFQKLVEEQKKNESKGFMSESGNIPMHGQSDTAAKARAQDLNLAAAFDYLLDPSKKMLSAEAVEQISDLGKIGLNSTSDSHSASLPLAYETDLAGTVLEQLKAGVAADTRAIQPDAWINKFVKDTSEFSSSVPQVTFHIESAPWSSSEKLLFVQVRAPLKTESESYKDVWVYAPGSSQSAAAYQEAFQQLGLKFNKMEKDFSRQLDTILTDALQKKLPLTLLLQADLASTEAQLLKLKMEQHPKLEIRLIWGQAVLSESGRLMRSFFATNSHRGSFIHAPTPHLTKKALDVLSAQEPVYWSDVRLNWSPNKEVLTSSQVVGLETHTPGSTATSSTGWLVPGDQVLTAIRLNLKSGSAIEGQNLGVVNFQFRQSASSPVESFKMDVDFKALRPSKSKSNLQFASLVLWLGLGLKQEVEVAPGWLETIAQQSQTLVLPKDLLPAHQEFMSLLEALK